MLYANIKGQIIVNAYTTMACHCSSFMISLYIVVFIL